MSGITVNRIVDGKAKEFVLRYETQAFKVQLSVIPSE